VVAINRGSEEMHAWVNTGRVDVVVLGEVAHGGGCEATPRGLVSSSQSQTRVCLVYGKAGGNNTLKRESKSDYL